MMKAWAAQSPSSLRATLSSDGFHMGDQGYACFARALAGDIAQEGARIGKPAAAKMRRCPRDVAAAQAPRPDGPLIPPNATRRCAEALVGTPRPFRTVQSRISGGVRLFWRTAARL